MKSCDKWVEFAAFSYLTFAFDRSRAGKGRSELKLYKHVAKTSINVIDHVKYKVNVSDYDKYYSPH